MKITLGDIQAAQKILEPYLIRTQLTHSRIFSRRLGSEVYLKFENEQRTGSFKIRGAMNKIATLSAEEKLKGLICCSAGNHAQGVAFSASQLGVPVKVVMPTNAPLVKMSATRGYGAEVITYGDYFDEALKYARDLEEQNDYVFIHPFEDEKIIAGQGTIGLEIAQTLTDLDTIVVPVGGGGLISGVAAAVKASNPKVRVIGVQSEQARGMASMFNKQSYEPPQGYISTIADGIAIKYPSRAMYDSLLSQLVDEMVTVNDNEVSEAIVQLIETARSVVEGSGAVGLAAALSGKIQLGAKTCILLSGGNIDLNIISKVIDRGLQQKGRLVKLSVVAPDLPGTLSRLTAIIAEQKANVLQVHHERVAASLGLKETVVDFVLETTSHEHIEQIRRALIHSGAKLLG